MWITIPYQIEIYQTASGRKPFVEWLEFLDQVTRSRIKERLDRLALGNLGDYKLIKKGVFELKLNFGAGYRVYFGKQRDNQFILLLCAGNKSTQKRDIQKALEYWQDYKVR